MANANSRFVEVSCQLCSCKSKIRLDQYRRKNETWTCRSCTTKGRPNARKGTGVINDPDLARTRNSFYKAQYRCKTGHGGYYKDVEFKFKHLQEIIDEIGIRPENTTLDRIDNSGHYEPGNVRWATIDEQVRNRKSNIFVKYKGEKMCLEDAARISGKDPGVLRRRLKTGCPPEFLFADGKWFSKTQKFFPV